MTISYHKYEVLEPVPELYLTLMDLHSVDRGGFWSIERGR